MSKVIKGILIKEDKVEIVEVENSLIELYKLLNCDLIQVVERKIGDKVYDIICDEEGLLKPNFQSAICSNYTENLYGNILIVNHDDEGNFTSLSNDEIIDINKSILELVDVLQLKIRKVLKYSVMGL